METQPEQVATASLWIKDILVPLVSAFLGAVIGGLFAIWASAKATATAHKNASALESKQRKALIRGLLIGLQTEIGSLRRIYENEFLADLENLQDGLAFEVYYPISQGYFTVFESSAHLIGQIEDDELQKIILEIYLKAKAVIDTHLLNNRMLDERSEIISRWTSPNLVLDARIRDINQELVDYAPNIRQNYSEARELIDRFEERFPLVLQKYAPDC